MQGSIGDTPGRWGDHLGGAHLHKDQDMMGNSQAVGVMDHMGFGYPDLRTYFPMDDLVLKKSGFSSSRRRCHRTEEELLSPRVHRRLCSHQG